jgi:hypothetical protein
MLLKTMLLHKVVSRARNSKDKFKLDRSREQAVIAERTMLGWIFLVLVLAYYAYAVVDGSEHTAGRAYRKEVVNHPIWDFCLGGA